MVKLYISRKGLEYTEHNVSQDRDSLKNLVSMGYRSTPVTVIGDEKIVGYIDEANQGWAIYTENWQRAIIAAKNEKIFVAKMISQDTCLRVI